MELENSQLQEIADEYNFSICVIQKFYNRIKNYPCVIAMDDQTLIDCIYLFVQDRVSMSQIISLYDGRNTTLDKFVKEKYKAIEYSISDALYRIYGDESIPHLSDEYMFINEIKKVRCKTRNY